MAWDRGVAHETWALPFSATPTEPLDVLEVRDDHLRSPNGAIEDRYIERLIVAARQEGERITQRPLVITRYQMVLDGFPGREIVLPYPPLTAVESLVYLDSDGVEQTLIEDTDFYVIAPQGPTAGKAKIYPTYSTTWPSTRSVANAVTVTFEAGYVDGSSPPVLDVPKDITDGMLLWIGERYKQRSLSVHALNQQPAVIQARNLWLAYRAY